ncbi:MAG TPA: cytochrome c [Candidatus Sulfotelmatobacter sp.]|nr:cytochrome c [Candidatus Sulfotelmatobacter sp.]
MQGAKTFLSGFLLILSSTLLADGLAFPQETKIGKLQGHAQRGKALYRRYCIGCHGPEGNGAGENAPYLDPKPRDFTLGLFKCRSTPSGSIPLDTDLFDTITRGIHGTFMPSWNPLPPQQRADLIAYVKTFSPRFREERPDPAIQIPPETPESPQSIQRGNLLYNQLKCFECHGAEGHGDGPSAPTLRDAKGNMLPPYDFTSSPHFKCGTTDSDLYRTLMTGLDGTPMPSYAPWLNPEQLWDVVHFLRSLARPGRRSAAQVEAAAALPEK